MKPAILALALASLSVGCVHRYDAPTPQEPHATIKIRRSFESSAGTHLREQTTVTGYVAESDVVGASASSAPQTSAIIVHPIPAEIGVGASFFHSEIRTVDETYTVQVPYTSTESYSCGSGTHYQTCTRMVTNYRSETRHRTVTKPVDVVDAQCRASVRLAPQVGHLYVVDFTFRENDACSASCVEQIEILSDGSFKSAPCPAPNAKQSREIDEASD
jgi:hypothetical protein